MAKDILESRFQSELKKELKRRYPGCIVLKNDPNCIQGFPDLTVLHGQRWAVLENKRNESAAHRPNQDYYVEKLDRMGFSRFIYPENKEEVLLALDRYFASGTTD